MHRARIAFVVRPPSQRSTRLSQGDEVGMKMEVEARLSLQPCAHGGVFVGLVVVQDQVQVEMLRDLTVENA